MANEGKRSRRQARGASIEVGRILGVQVGIDWSLAIIFFLILFSLGFGWFPARHPEWSSLAVWGSALAAAILFFVSVLAHEMSHAIVGNRRGIPVRRITLFIFGGLAHMEDEPPSAGAELTMAIIGPIVSIAIGIGAWVLTWAVSGYSPVQVIGAEGGTAVAAETGVYGPVAAVLFWLGLVNILLGVFNLIPGFPLDGGRVLRAAIWGVTGDMVKATRWSSYIGRGFAWMLIGWGAYTLLFFGLWNGFWWILIGWFLNNAARASYYQLLMRQAFEDVAVRDLMRPAPTTISPDLTVDALVQNYIMASDQRAFPVVQGAELIGLVSLEDVRKVPRSEWARVRVERIMTPAGELRTVEPEDEAFQAFHALANRGVNQLPVVEEGHLAGLLRREDIMKWMSLRGHPTES